MKFAVPDKRSMHFGLKVVPTSPSIYGKRPEVNMQSCLKWCTLNSIGVRGAFGFQVNTHGISADGGLAPDTIRTGPRAFILRFWATWPKICPEWAPER